MPNAVPLQRSGGTSKAAAPGTAAAPVVVPLGKPNPRAPHRTPSPAPTAPAFTSVPAAPPVRTAARPTPRPAVQRRSAQAASPAPAPTPTPAPAAAPPRPAPATRKADAPAPPAPGETRDGGGTPSVTPASSPADLDDLARRLLAPLSRLLRAELRGDRERIGRLRDHGR